MKKPFIILITLLGAVLMIECSNNTKENKIQNKNTIGYFTRNSKIYDVIENTSFSDFGNLIFPVDRQIDQNMTLEEIENLYIWYNYIDPDKTVEIVNYMKQEVDSGKQINIL